MDMGKLGSAAFATIDGKINPAIHKYFSSVMIQMGRPACNVYVPTEHGRQVLSVVVEQIEA